MTKRLPDSERKIRARDDLTPVVKPKKRGVNATPEAKAARIAKLRETGKPTTTGAQAALANPNRPLTEKQRLFVKIWAEGETIRSAAMRAGYTDGGAVAYRLARDPAILKIYDREKALYEQAAQMTRKDVMDMLKESYDCAKMMSEPASMVSAAREIGKMCGYYEPVTRNINVNVQGELTVKKLERMSDDDLLNLIKGDIEDVEFKEVEDEDGEQGLLGYDEE